MATVLVDDAMHGRKPMPLPDHFLGRKNGSKMRSRMARDARPVVVNAQFDAISFHSVATRRAHTMVPAPFAHRDPDIAHGIHCVARVEAQVEHTWSTCTGRA